MNSKNINTETSSSYLQSENDSSIPYESETRDSLYNQLTGKYPSINIVQLLIDWINTIKQPNCLVTSNLNQLTDGVAFTEILKQLLINNGIDEKEININMNLNNEERIKIVLVSLIELSSGDDKLKKKAKYFYKNKKLLFTDEIFLVKFIIFYKKLYENISIVSNLNSKNSVIRDSNSNLNSGLTSNEKESIQISPEKRVLCEEFNSVEKRNDAKLLTMKDIKNISNNNTNNNSCTKFNYSSSIKKGNYSGSKENDINSLGSLEDIINNNKLNDINININMNNNNRIDEVEVEEGSTYNINNNNVNSVNKLNNIDNKNDNESPIKNKDYIKIIDNTDNSHISNNINDQSAFNKSNNNLKDSKKFDNLLIEKVSESTIINMENDPSKNYTQLNNKNQDKLNNYDTNVSFEHNSNSHTNPYYSNIYKKKKKFLLSNSLSFTITSDKKKMNTNLSTKNMNIPNKMSEILNDSSHPDSRKNKSKISLKLNSQNNKNLESINNINNINNINRIINELIDMHTYQKNNNSTQMLMGIKEWFNKDSFKYIKILKITEPIIDIDISNNDNLYKKYNTKIYNVNQKVSNNDDNDSSDNKEGILNINKVDHKKYKNEQSIKKWLINLNILDKTSLNEGIVNLLKNGVVFCDILNRCENKNKVIKGIIRNPLCKSHIKLNIQKFINYIKDMNIFHYYIKSIFDNANNFNCNNNYSYYDIQDEILNENEDIIYNVIDGLYRYYNNIKSTKTDISNNNNNQINYKVNKVKNRSTISHLKNYSTNIPNKTKINIYNEYCKNNSKYTDKNISNNYLTNFTNNEIDFNTNNNNNNISNKYIPYFIRDSKNNNIKNKIKNNLRVQSSNEFFDYYSNNEVNEPKKVFCTMKNNNNLLLHSDKSNKKNKKKIFESKSNYDITDNYMYNNMNMMNLNNDLSLKNNKKNLNSLSIANDPNYFQDFLDKNLSSLPSQISLINSIPNIRYAENSKKDKKEKNDNFDNSRHFKGNNNSLVSMDYFNIENNDNNVFRRRSGVDNISVNDKGDRFDYFDVNGGKRLIGNKSAGNIKNSFYLKNSINFSDKNIFGGGGHNISNINAGGNSGYGSNCFLLFKKNNLNKMKKEIEMKERIFSNNYI